MSRFAAALLIAALTIAACASSTTPSPTVTVAPSATPSPTASASPGSPLPNPTVAPTPSDQDFVANGWPLTVPGDGSGDNDPVFAPNGTAYFAVGRPGTGIRDQLIALDRGGFMMAGFPVHAQPGSGFGPPATGEDGSLYIEECGGATVGCAIHRLDAGGQEVRGWPLVVPSEFACAGPSCFDTLTVAGLTLYLSHWRDVGGLQLIAIDPTGQIRPGWPSDAGLEGGFWSDPQFFWDGSVHMLWRPDGGPGTASIVAFGLDGRVRPGWPVAVPDLERYLVFEHGVIAWSWENDTGELCPNPARTVFTVIGLDGQVLAGWPRGSTGYASSPVSWGNGIRYVSATGRVYSHDLSGEITAGWPYTAAGAIYRGCAPAPAFLAPNGATFVFGDVINSLTVEGRQRTGWPYVPEGELVWPSLDIDGGPASVAPAFMANSVGFFVLFVDDPGGAFLEVIALGDRGELLPGWPRRLSIDPVSATVDSFRTSPDGRLFIRSGDVILALDGGGNVSR